MAQRTILLVEDEDTLARAVQYSLEKEGFAVRVATDGAQGISLARGSSPDLVLLDLMLPGVDGLDVCRALRRESPVPIVMLTAKSEEVDKVVGLELGADDYITKPFSMRELIARVRAQLRRAEMTPPTGGGGADGSVVASGTLRMDLSGRHASLDSAPLRLRPKEFDLLAFLLRNRGTVLSREILLDRVWGYDYAGDTRTVDVHVRWLREKIESDPGNPVRLLTVRSVGYKFES